MQTKLQTKMVSQSPLTLANHCTNLLEKIGIAQTNDRGINADLQSAGRPLPSKARSTPGKVEFNYQKHIFDTNFSFSSAKFEDVEVFDIPLHGGEGRGNEAQMGRLGMIHCVISY